MERIMFWRPLKPPICCNIAGGIKFAIGPKPCPCVRPPCVRVVSLVVSCVIWLR
jgi:hypothetical protein